MRGLFLIILLFSLNSQAVPASSWPKTNTKIKDINSKEITWAPGKNGALIVFTSAHCPLDNAWFSRILKHANWAQKNDFFVAFINSHSPTKYHFNEKSRLLESLNIQNKGIHYIVDENQALAKIFRAQRSPSAFVFNSDKNRTYFGAIDDQPESSKEIKEEYLKTALSNTLKGKKVGQNYIHPLGCKIEKEK